MVVSTKLEAFDLKYHCFFSFVFSRPSFAQTLLVFCDNLSRELSMGGRYIPMLVEYLLLTKYQSGHKPQYWVP